MSSAVLPGPESRSPSPLLPRTPDPRQKKTKTRGPAQCRCAFRTPLGQNPSPALPCGQTKRRRRRGGKIPPDFSPQASNLKSTSGMPRSPPSATQGGSSCPQGGPDAHKSHPHTTSIRNTLEVFLVAKWHQDSTPLLAGSQIPATPLPDRTRPQRPNSAKVPTAPARAQTRALGRGGAGLFQSVPKRNLISSRVNFPPQLTHPRAGSRLPPAPSYLPAWGWGAAGGRGAAAEKVAGSFVWEKWEGPRGGGPEAAGGGDGIPQ